MSIYYQSESEYVELQRINIPTMNKFKYTNQRGVGKKFCPGTKEISSKNKKYELHQFEIRGV